MLTIYHLIPTRKDGKVASPAFAAALIEIKKWLSACAKTNYEMPWEGERNSTRASERA
jgi:hypothetical protein